jgi:two-component system NtrC family sensor kinase
MKLPKRPLFEATSRASLRSFKVLAIASVMAPAVLFVAFAIITYDIAFRHAEERASHLASILQDHAQRVFEAVSIALASARYQISGLDDETIRSSESVWQQLTRIQKAAPQIGSIFVTDHLGMSLLTTREFPPPAINFADRDYYQAHLQRQVGLYIGRRYVGKISHEPIFNFSIAREEKDGQFNGVVGSSADVEYFRDFYATVGQASDDYSVLLLRADGELLARYPEVDRNINLGFDFFRSDQQQIWYVVSPVDGVPRLYASAKVGEYPVYVAYAISISAIRKQWEQGLVVPAALAFGMCGILSLLTSFAYTRVRREGVAVQQLKEAANSLAIEIDRRHQAEQSLQQAQKFDAIGRLAGSIAHDFNNLLMIICGNLGLALRRADLREGRRFVQTAQQAADRGAALTRRLLAFSRGQNLRPIVVSPIEILDSAKNWVPHAVSDEIELKFVRAEDLWPICMDVPQFEAALLNLVVNARDAMAGRGTLTISAQNVALKDGEVPDIASGEYVLVSVSDTGCGIPPEVMARIFEPFFSTKAPGKGTGLGMSQVHDFVQRTGGGISIESERHRGTTVRLFLPRSRMAPDLASPAEPFTTAMPKEDAVVLVVEDDPHIRQAIVTMLFDLGYAALAVRSAAECLAMLSAGEPVDILITDIVMSRGPTGLELSEKVQELRPDLPILLVSASLSVTSNLPLLVKPFTSKQLAEALAALMNADWSRSEAHNFASTPRQ